MAKPSNPSFGGWTDPYLELRLTYYSAPQDEEKSLCQITFKLKYRICKAESSWVQTIILDNQEHDEDDFDDDMFI